MGTVRIYLNQSLRKALRIKIGRAFNEGTGLKVASAVHSAIVNARGRDLHNSEIRPGVTLASDLFAEDADGLAIAESLESALGISFPRDRGAVALRVLYRGPAAGDYTERTVLELAVEAYRLASGENR